MTEYTRKDRFFKKAKQDNFAARSAYKLEEIDRRFRLFHEGARVVDLGCAPGSWLQYLAKAIGSRGLVTGYDLEPIKVSAGPRVRAFQVDIETLTPETIQRDIAALLAGNKKATAAAPPSSDDITCDALISDMAPKLTGIRDRDQACSMRLAEKALALADALVVEEGCFVTKTFQGRGTEELVLAVKDVFRDVRLLRPEATRQGSREAFIIARRRKPRTGRSSEPESLRD